MYDKRFIDVSRKSELHKNIILPFRSILKLTGPRVIRHSSQYWGNINA